MNAKVMGFLTVWALFLTGMAVSAPPDKTPPAAPTNLTATAVSSSEIDLDWDDNTEPDLDGYNIYRATSPGVRIKKPNQIASGVIVSNYSDSGLDASTTYYYVVTAVDVKRNESDGSNEAFATTSAGDTTPPAAPTNLTATVVGSSRIDLDWDDNTEPDLSSYNVYRDGSPMATGVLPSSYSDTGLAPATTYCYAVTAVDTSDNESGESNPACATTEPGGACGSPSGGPADNPIATFYGPAAYPWTDEIKWECVYNVDDYSGTATDKFDAARDEAYANGGGVVYFPAGTYTFDGDLYVADGVVIRGATPANTDAKSGSFAPPTRFEFPEYVESTSGNGTDNATAFKTIYTTDPDNDSNIGVVWVDINRSKIYLVSTNPSSPAIAARNMVVFGVRINNAGDPDPGVPDLSFQHGWQRWMYRFCYNLKLYNAENILVANTRHNDNITDNYEQPGYLVLDGGDVISLDQSGQAVFNYTNHYVMEVGKGSHDWGPGTPVTMPANFREGIVIRDNWMYHTMRVAIMARGMGLQIFDNVIRDQSDKVCWVHPAGKALVGNSNTLENRAIDFGGWNVIINNNDYEVYRHLLKDGPYYSVDGEGILAQECCGGTSINGVIITDNFGPHATYIGLYKVQDIYDAYIAGNSINGGGLGIYVNANTNSANYTCDYVVIEGNVVNANIHLYGDGGSGVGNQILNNTASGSGRHIKWSCETNAQISGNSGFTVDACQ